jgi:hypothetical protein
MREILYIRIAHDFFEPITIWRLIPVTAPTDWRAASLEHVAPWR